MAKVDIVIPCYNYGRFLEDCLNSVLSQSISDVRVLIIDDASSDGSQAVAESLAASDPRVSFISHRQNRGHIKTYNEGIDWLESDYFLLLSADDLLVPDALERACLVMDENPDVVLTHGDGIAWRDDTPFPSQIGVGDGLWNRQDIVADFCKSGANLVTTPTAIVRTSAQKSIGGYEIDLPHSADMAMWLKFAAIGSVARIHAVQAIYRLHSSNMSGLYCADKLPDYEQRKAAFEKFFRSAHKLPPHAAALEAQAYRTLAEKAYWTGVGQLLRGRAQNAAALLRFATRIESQLCFFPPFLRLLQTARVARMLGSLRAICAPSWFAG